jgi:hypothetical protein
MLANAMVLLSRGDAGGPGMECLEDGVRMKSSTSSAWLPVKQRRPELLHPVAWFRI